MHNLTAPKNPKNMSYVDIVAKIRAQFEPKTLIIAQRYHFNRRDQNASETITAYLRRLAETSAFTGDQLIEVLRDRLVCGLRNESIQKRIFTKPN